MLLEFLFFSIIDVDLEVYGYYHSNDFSKHKIKDI